jgi:4-amino-4-deoxy-L-arabinose transferase-like glycosyltransferase
LAWLNDTTEEEPSLPQLSSRRMALAMLLVITLLGLALRLYNINGVALDLNEGASFFFANFPLADLWGTPARLETNPPLFYTISRAVVLLTGSAEAMRYLAAFFGVLCVPATYWIGTLLGGRFVGLSAAALVATSALQVESSQVARTYSLFTLSALVVIAAQIVLLKSYPLPASRASARVISAWGVYIAAGIVALYAHNTAVLVIGTLNLAALYAWIGALDRDRKFAVHYIGANLVLLAVYCWWIPIILYQSVHLLADFWLPRPGLTDLRWMIQIIYGQRYIVTLQPFADLAFMLLGLWGFVSFRRAGAIVTGLAVFVVAGTPLLFWVISQWRPIMIWYALSWLTPVFLVYVALGCAAFRRWAPFVVVPLVLVQLAGDGRFYETRVDEGWRKIATEMKAEAQPGDLVYLDPPISTILLDYYGWPRERLEISGSLRRTAGEWFIDHFHDQYLGLDAFAERAHGAKRVWVISRWTPQSHREIADRLKDMMTEVSHEQFGNGRTSADIEVSLFEAR